MKPVPAVAASRLESMCLQDRLEHLQERNNLCSKFHPVSVYQAPSNFGTSFLTYAAIPSFASLLLNNVACNSLQEQDDIQTVSPIQFGLNA